MTFDEMPQGAQDAYRDVEVANDFSMPVKTCVEEVANERYTITGVYSKAQAMTVELNNYGTASYRFRAAID